MNATNASDETGSRPPAISPRTTRIGAAVCESGGYAALPHRPDGTTRPDIAPEAATPQSRKRHQLNQRICAAVWTASG